MKFSIVTLAFRQRRFIREAIESVLGQDYPDIEYIVVEPGSADGTREIVEQYADRIALKIYDPDDGAADGLNKGFARATGDVFAFLNGDDLLLPRAVSRVAQFLDANPTCDLVMGSGYVANVDGIPLRRVRASSFTVTNYLYGSACWLQQATFIRRRAFEATGGFNAANRTSWDGELFVNAVANGARVGYIEDELGVFRVHGESITGSGRAREAYRQDHARLFRQLLGRDRAGFDELVGLLHRGRRLLQDPSRILDAVRARLQAPRS
jgi:glycosyltransferase involved in cell wall biosynthesis